VVLQNVKVLIDEETIQARVKELACRISDDYRDKETPLMVGLLDGVHIFMSDLVRYMDIDLEEVFIKASSYGEGTESSGKVDIYCYKPLDVKGRHVIIVDELIDTGNTLEALLNLFKDQGAASLEICTFLSKPERRLRDVHVKYLGQEVENVYLIGYGMDKAGLYRNLPYVGYIEE